MGQDAQVRVMVFIHFVLFQLLFYGFQFNFGFNTEESKICGIFFVSGASRVRLSINVGFEHG